ncbi:hypothetical protein, partial [Mesorhizobium sp. M5C.F.Ca.ET.164.01.1.1]|uniref:hypothetical protein n=1 Tax=Mesorhizobium sp. M5C.F.Ca.ET.164.01.1.1 TaxID=2563957 RepID=UPI00167BBC2B
GVFEALRVIAVLSALRCVDPIEADALARDLDGVAIDHRGTPPHRTWQLFGPIRYGALNRIGALDHELSICDGEQTHAQE